MYQHKYINIYYWKNGLWFLLCKIKLDKVIYNLTEIPTWRENPGYNDCETERSDKFGEIPLNYTGSFTTRKEKLKNIKYIRHKDFYIW